MIKSISIVSKLEKESVIFDNNFDSEIAINCSKVIANLISSFDIEILFSEPIASFRNHDYSWVDLSFDRIANSFSPKIIQLSNGFYVQSNSNQGIWEVQKKYPKKLIWRFNPEKANPLSAYTGNNNQKTIVNSKSNFDDFISPSLLFSKINALEISSSKIPFVATVCFTDHCDFDTLKNLETQRSFFKKNNIKITKGFFLNHYSKRDDNASWQNDQIELEKWITDGHELCYHSLSQSIKSKEESSSDFYTFKPPITIKTWIDHGYQPYNLSLYQKETIDEVTFAENLAKKEIEILWNYIDSGTATSGVLNQLNTNYFTLQSFYNGIKNKSVKKRISLSIKNAIVHFYCNEKLIKYYAQLASSYKKISTTKSIFDFFTFLKKCFNVAVPLIKIVLFWNSYKMKTYPLAKFQTIFFNHTIGTKKFIIFQTLEFLDFVNALNKKSVDQFISEKGMFVGHTYFSVPLEYHDGKLYTKSGEINPIVDANFEYLGQNISENKIWNPTLIELVEFWKDFNKIVFQISENGEISIKNNTEIPFRKIT